MKRHRPCPTLLSILLFGGILLGILNAPVKAATITAKTYLVVGTGSIRGSSLNAAKEQAIAACKASAVQLMTAELMPLEILVQQFPTVDRLIFQKADRYIQYYKVLSKNREDRHYRVLVQVKVSARQIADQLRKSGIMTTNAKPLTTLTVTVVGTQDLASFVLFRSSLSKLEGVESVQNREMLPNQTTLAVNYRGTAGTFAEALVVKKYAGFSARVYDETENTFRVELIPDENPGASNTN
ncbi:MAG: hypothetical protein JJV98_20600 [Desulfosarcina sp.]|nr:hypothetical protein [Desulfobacterales bacterium]